jgi:hypothetical protein
MILADPANPRGIVWIASYPASGNTWVRLFLYHLMRATAGVPNVGGEINNVGRSSLYEIQQVALFQEFLKQPVTEVNWHQIATVRPQVQAAIANRSSGVVLVKTHSVLGGIQGLETISLGVSAGSIYVVRDPRDVAVSLAAHFSMPIDKAIAIMATSAYRTETTSEAVFEIWGSWSQNVQGWTMKPHEAALVLRYEDILADPRTQFTAVSNHLRQSPTPEQLTDAIESVAFKRLQEEERADSFHDYDGKAGKFFRVGRAGQWREKLSQAQVNQIVETHGDQMRRFGYLSN